MTWLRRRHKQPAIERPTTNEGWQQFHKEARERSLEQMRTLGTVVMVQVVSVNDDRTCEDVHRYETKIYTLVGGPPLPTHGCDADFCRCQFLAVAPDPCGGSSC